MGRPVNNLVVSAGVGVPSSIQTDTPLYYQEDTSTLWAFQSDKTWRKLAYLDESSTYITSDQSAINRASIVVTHSQILTLVAAGGITVVPAPGVGKCLMPLGCAISAKIVTPYSNIATGSATSLSDGTFFLVLDPTNDWDSTDPTPANYLIGTGPTNRVAWLPVMASCASLVVVSPIPSRNNFSFFQNDRTLIENQPLALSLQNSLGNVTGGDPTNTLKVTIWYVVFDL